MPSAVSFLVWSQFVLFTSFGVVSTLQVLYAKPLPLDVTEEFTKGKVDRKRAWSKVSLRYSILSVTAKTLLEVGFVWVVSIYKPFPIVTSLLHHAVEGPVADDRMSSSSGLLLLAGIVS